jgi:DNA-binding transcriptional MerR regulator
MTGITGPDVGSLTIGQVTERTGLSAHALRFYERQGILPDPVERSASGRRIYTDRDVEWILNCTRFRASGMSVATIRQFAQLVRSGAGNEQERLELLQRHQQVIIDRINELTDCLGVITNKVAVYERELAQGTAGALWRDPPAS